MSEVDAAKQLASDTAITQTALKPGQARADEPPPVDLSEFYAGILAKAPKFNMQAYMYLVKNRGIPEKILNEAIKRGMLRFLPGSPEQNAQWLRKEFGDEELRRLNLWKENSRMPWIAYRPITFLFPSLKSAEWRIASEPKEGESKALRGGQEKGHWFWKGTDNKKVAIVEGAIDMLSMVAMGWGGDIKALAGTGTWKDEWLDGYDYAALTLDNDEAGRITANKISEIATAKGIPNTIRLPQAGDINAELLLRRKRA